MSSSLSGPAGGNLRGYSSGKLPLPGKGYNERIPSGYKGGRLNNFTPEQMELFQQAFGQVSPDSYTARLAGGDQSQFAEMEEPAWRDFQEAQGDLASRFSNMGMGARRGSGFQNAAGQQASDFAMNLRSQRHNLQRQAIQDLMGMTGDLLNQRPYETFLEKKAPKKKKWWESLLGGFGGDNSSDGGGLGQNIFKTASLFF